MNKKILILSASFFVAVNTTYFWEGLIGIWGIPVTIALFVIFVILAFIFLIQLVKSIQQRFQNRHRLLSLVIISAVLGLTAIAPFGIIDFDKLQGDDLLIADVEGAANCRTTLKLKTKSRFYIRSVCFGVDKSSGTYSIEKDTIRFSTTGFKSSDEVFHFGVLKLEQSWPIDSISLLYLYGPNQTERRLRITKNKLFKIARTIHPSVNQ